MSHAAVVEHIDPVVPIEKSPLGITNGKFGMWMFLCQDCMGFVGLFGAYAALRMYSDKWYDPADPSGKVLGIWLTAIMTFVLICSSVSMVFALDACKRDDQAGLKKWLGLTILGGVAFLGGQVYEYQHLLSEPWRHPSAHNFWATFYSLTSFHGLHVLGGVIYLTCMWIGAARGKYGSRNSTPIEIVGLYWHFVDLVWILLFTFVYLISPAAGAKLPVPV